MLAASDGYSIWQVFLWIIWFMLWVAWIILLFQVFNDIFRRKESGWAKAAWSLFVIIFPLIGTLVYLIVNGDGMASRDMRSAEANEAATRAYIREAAGTGGPADQLDALHKMHEAGQLSDAEYAQAKAKVLS